MWLLEGHDGRAKVLEARIPTMSQHHMRLPLQPLAARRLSPRQVVDATTAKSNDLEIDERPAADTRLTRGARGSPRDVSALYMSRELRRRR